MKAALQVSGNLTVCPTPLRLDSYDGCSAGCAYCFARVAALSSTGQGGKHDSFGRVESRAPLIGPKLAGVGKSGEAAMRRLGVPVHLGGMADPFQPCERKQRVALGHLEQIAEARAPVVVSTKFGLLAEEPWRSAWEAIPQRLLQVSLIAPDDALERLEPGAPSWRERLAFLREMAAETPCVIRVQPYIGGLSDLGIAALCKAAAEAGVKAIIVEGLKLPTRAWKQIDAALSSVLGAAYKRPENKTGGDRDYPWKAKFGYQLAARKLAREHGLGHYAADNALRWLGDSAQCCATDLMAGEVGHWRANWGHVVEEALRSGEVRFGWILGAMGEGCYSTSSMVNGGNGVSRRSIYGSGKQVVGAWYRHIWNQTRNGIGPQAIIPNLIATHEDENGDAVYRFVLPEAIREAVFKATGEKVRGGYMSTEEALRVSRDARGEV